MHVVPSVTGAGRTLAFNYVTPSLFGDSYPGSEGKASAWNAGGHSRWIPGLGRCPGEGHCNPFQYSCLEISMPGGTWRATVPWGRKESDMTERLTLSIQDLKILLMVRNKTKTLE